MDGDGAWRKGVAVREGVFAAGTDIVVVADADVWAPGVEVAVECVQAGAPWAKPFDRFTRLTKAATETIYGGRCDPDQAARLRSSHEERPYRQLPAGGIVVLPRETALRIPIDPRFVGWGGQDYAWRDALDTLAGDLVEVKGPLYHLWHPPQKRASRIKGSDENALLQARYAAARGKAAEMRALVAEALAVES